MEQLSILNKPSVAYATQADATLNKFLAIYTIIPAIFVILQFVPILFYDMVGDKKDRITAALAKKRSAEAEGAALEAELAETAKETPIETDDSSTDDESVAE